MNLKNRPIKELSIYTDEIMKTYQKAKLDSFIRTDHDGETRYLIRLGQNKVQQLNAHEYKNAIERILDKLPKEQRYILEELFITKPINPLWYEEKLSRATYYRYKRLALENFLMFF